MLYEINQDALRYEMEHLGVYKPSVAIMLGKGKITPLKLLQVRTPAANIIKQEMNQKHYKTLLYKLKQMPYFGIPSIVTELERYLTPAPKCTRLADGRVLRYDSVQVMGILNVTPDSFYAGSRLTGMDAVLARAETMLTDGATVLDIGGESTRPGSDPVTEEEERARVLPAVEAIKKKFPEAVISIDTYRAALAREALQRGGDMINDISAMTADEMMPDVVETTKAPIILMHRKGVSKNMQQQCEYKNVVQEVTEYLLAQAAILREKQIGKDKVILDPGIGFAKNDEQNLRLMQNLNALTVQPYPVLMAASRKTTIGNVLATEAKGLIPAPPEERLEGTLAVTAAAVFAGASLVRVHDVKENVRMIRMLEAIRKV